MHQPFLIMPGRTLPAEPHHKPVTSKNAAEPTHHPARSDDWMVHLRALVHAYEEERWHRLNDGTESRNFVPVRMRLVKHYFDLYDSARLANDEASAAIMKSRLERMAFNHPRWGKFL